MDVGFGKLVANVLGARMAPARPSLVADARVARELRVHGYCATDHVLSDDCLGALDEVLAARRPELEALDGGSVVALSFGDPSGLDAEAMAPLVATLVPEVERVTVPSQARVLPAPFQVKPSSARSFLEAHLDANLVDESAHRGLNAWVSLSDSTATSGALFFLPGSHRFGLRTRLGSEYDELAPYARVVERHARVVASRRGQVVLFDNATIHGSTANASGARRVAATCMIVPRQATLTIPIGGDDLPDGTAQLFHIPPADLDRGIGSGPLGEVAGTVSLDRLAVGARQLEVACRLAAARHPAPPGDPFAAVAAAPA